MTLQKISKLIPFIALVFLVGSCNVNSDLMLKTPKDYEYEPLDSLRSKLNNEEYIIKVDDIIQFRFQTNNGIRILDIAAGTNEGGGMVGNQMNSVSAIQYVINADSLVKLPYINQVNLVGKTIREAERFLQEAYKNYYVDPFIQITVTNKRVLVFPGNGGDAQVVNLMNNNTTLIEAIALAGGISDRGKARRIKLIREVEGERKVFLIDLSTIDGLSHVDVVVQNGDYIYIEPAPQLGREVFVEIAPIFSILSSTFAIIFAISRL